MDGDPGLRACGLELAHNAESDSWPSTRKDLLPLQIDVFHQPIVTVLQGLRIIQIVAGVVIQHLLGFARGSDIVLHRDLVEVLLEIGELEQQWNWRCASHEMDGVDVSCDLCIFFELTRRLAFAQLNKARIVATQQNVPHPATPAIKTDVFIRLSTAERMDPHCAP